MVHHHLLYTISNSASVANTPKSSLMRTNPTDIFTLVSGSADREGLIEKVITETMTEPTMEEYVNKTRGDYYSGITKTMINGKAAYELKGKFLDDLLVVFPISLTGDASEWLMNEPQSSITTWVHLTEKFFGKYYPPSRTSKIVGTKAKWDSTNVVFENWLALKFTNHMMMDPFTKNDLWDYLKNSNDQEELTDEAFSDLEWGRRNC
ncbi:hypothetical protein Tco_0774163 [Tanacetum coccineum]|uniref:Retrotransposon gag domain-containing protein n=1 Tax=Tanacetum coccineum TaxID=301880 RepID=A0ABQ4ZRF6_9ASTR